MTKKGLALVTAGLILGTAGSAPAGPPPAMTAGGRTLAGPGRTTVAAGDTETIYTYAGSNTNACATVYNLSRTTDAHVALVGLGASVVERDVVRNSGFTLCHDNVARIDLSCLAQTACLVQWRIDRN